MRALVSATLSRFGFTVIVAPTSEDGLALAIAHPPTVVLCDVVLPDALGFDTVQCLKEHPATAHVPSVLFTGCPEMLNYALGENIKVLKKPFSTQEIIQMLTEAIQGSILKLVNKSAVHV